jgi:hypothetical protein
LRDIILFTVDSLGCNILNVCGFPPNLKKFKESNTYYSDAYSTAPSTHMSFHTIFTGHYLYHPWDCPTPYFRGFSKAVEKERFLPKELNRNTYAFIPWDAHGEDLSYSFQNWLGNKYNPDKDRFPFPALDSVRSPFFFWFHSFGMYRYLAKASSGFVRTITREDMIVCATPVLKEIDNSFSRLLNKYPDAFYIIAADHGDATGHGGAGHGFDLTKENLNVPLMHTGNPEVIEKPVSLLSINNIIRKAAGIPEIEIPDEVLFRTYFPLQGGGEIGGCCDKGIVRILLDGDRGSFIREKDKLLSVPVMGWVYYPSYCKELEALGNHVIESERFFISKSLELRC